MSKLFYDPLYQYIEFEPILVQIIDTPEFQRLRNIKQLGCSYFVFQSATHSRFEHSLGCAYLGERFMRYIRTNQPELNITDRDIILIKTALLCHDIGHLAYSHAFDNYIIPIITTTGKLNKHEYRSIELFKFIINKYNIPYSNDEVNTICNMINPPKELENNYMYQLVNNRISGLDLDKLDYLNRDCHHLGLPYTFTYSRLLKFIRVIDNELTFVDKEINNIFELYEIRYKLHQQIYTHPTTTKIESMITDIFIELSKVYPISEWIYNPDKYIYLTDNFIDQLLYNNDPKLKHARKIYNDISNRNLYKIVGEYAGINNKDSNCHYMKININFTKGSQNPLDYIKFYKLSDPDKSFYKDLNNHSLIIPKLYEKSLIRVVLRNKYI